MARFHPSKRPNGQKVVRPPRDPQDQVPVDPVQVQEAPPVLAQEQVPAEEDLPVLVPPAAVPVPPIARRRKRAAAKSLVPFKKAKNDHDKKEIAGNLASEHKNDVISILDNYKDYEEIEI